MKKKKDWKGDIRMICFDVDGTLYRDIGRVWEAVKPLAIDLVVQETGIKRDRVEDDFDREYLRVGSSTKVLKRFGINPKEFFKKKLETMDLTKVIDRNEWTVTGVRRLKEKGYRVSILSNGSLRVVKKKLAAIGLKEDDFEFVLTSDELGVSKPSRAAFEAVVGESGRMGDRLRYDQILYVGDREDIDIVGAKNAGMKAVLIGGKSELVDESFEDLSGLIGFI